jgi:hypothetical protein
VDLTTNTNDVFFIENVFYADFASQKKFLDISDVVQSTADGDTQTIESKLSDADKEFLTAFDGKYYALPHYECYKGVTYDIDLFVKKGFYFAADANNGNNGFILSKEDKKSVGPDGVYGTSDDGLPATYEEFYKLCNYMVECGVTPFVWTGMYADYSTNIAEMAYSNYTGADGVSLNYTYDSKGATTEIVTDFNSDGTPITQNVTITSENGYLLKQQTGRYYALEFFKTIVDNSEWYTSDSISPTYSHLDAQEDFVYSSLENKPIAMLVDGTWWYNEASGAMERSANDYGARAENRNFGWLPIPGNVSGTVTEENGSKNVICDAMRAYGFIKANIAENKIALAKAFLKFCYSDTELQAFTETTGCARNLEYSLTDEQYGNMTKYAQSIWDMKSTAERVEAYSTSKLFLYNQSALLTDMWASSVSRQSYKYPLNGFRAKVSAVDYFKGTWISNETWTYKDSKYFS